MKRSPAAGQELRVFGNLMKWSVPALIFALGSAPASGASLSTLYQSTHGDAGLSPLQPLVQVGNYLYGSTAIGGAFFGGTIFQFDPQTGHAKTIHSFKTQPSSCTDPDLQVALFSTAGVLYGVNSCEGVVFSIEPGTGRFSIVHRFDEKRVRVATALTGSDGNLYVLATSSGSTPGSIVRIGIASGTTTTLYNLSPDGSDGLFPNALTMDGQTLYVTCYSGGKAGFGTILAFDLLSGRAKPLYSFGDGADGAFPAAAVVRAERALFGTTSAGGTTGYGVAFKIDLQSGVESTIYTFTDPDAGAPSALILANGALYGSIPYGGTAHAGSVFSIDPMTGTEATVFNFPGGGSGGSAPVAPLTSFEGSLLGTTSGGGVDNGGTIFSLNPQDGSESIRFSFKGAPAVKNAGPIYVNGYLYGTTGSGGSASRGTVYAIDLATGLTKTLYEFTGAVDEENPLASLLYDNGMLYGTTFGNFDVGHNGTVFQVDPSSGAFKTIYTFGGGTDGASPLSNLIKVGRKLYGTTEFGGIYGAWTIYSVDAKTGEEAVIYPFTGNADGFLPASGLLNIANTLYGTTQTGGVAGYGVIFSYDVTTSVESTVYGFTGGADGGYPGPSLALDHGNLYGTAQSVVNGGTVFSLPLHTSNVSTICSSIGFNAGIMVRNGKLVGAASNQGYGPGWIYSCDPASGATSILYNFTGGSDGSNPYGRLVMHDNTLYGTTSMAGAHNDGTVFRFNP